MSVKLASQNGDGNFETQNLLKSLPADEINLRLILVKVRMTQHLSNEHQETDN
jgi:hypothetical protein